MSVPKAKLLTERRLPEITIIHTVRSLEKTAKFLTLVFIQRAKNIIKYVLKSKFLTFKLLKLPQAVI